MFCEIFYREDSDVRIGLREDGEERILAELDVAEPLTESLLKADDCAVEPVVLKLLIGVGNPADVDNDLGVGINLTECGQNGRQPAAGDAGISAEAQRGIAALPDCVYPSSAAAEVRLPLSTASSRA